MHRRQQKPVLKEQFPLPDPPSGVGTAAKHRYGQKGLSLLAGFIAKKELQPFPDASAVAACRHLDGTSSGVGKANRMALVGPSGSSVPNGWNYGRSAVSTVAVNYATSFSDYSASYSSAMGSSTNDYRLIGVRAQATLPLYFLRVIPGLPSQQVAEATAKAGQNPTSSLGNGGLEPFMPDAPNATDTQNFGFTPNVSFKLKWGNGNRNTKCAGE